MQLDRYLARLIGLRPRLRLPRRGLVAYLTAMGPGLIAASAGNDAGGIVIYAQAGAAYGHRLLWAFVVMGISLIVIQEMCARMGAVTGKGLSDLIREQFGVRWAVLAMLGLLVANAAITVSEFVGINAAARIIAGEPALRGTTLGALLPYAVVPLSAFGLWWLVTRQAREPVERVLLLLTLVFFAYIPAALIGEHHWDAVVRAVVTPSLGGTHDTGFVPFLIALIGTTISPFMQFFLQSAVVEKGVRPRDYHYTRVEVVASSVFAILIAMFIAIATAAALFGKPGAAAFTNAGAFATALRGVLGPWAETLFAVGLFGASLLAAAVLPLSTAFAVCEVFGFESGVDKSFAAAPVFNGIFTGLIALSAAVAVVVPADAIVAVLIRLQVINGVVLALELLFVLRLVNNRRLMGRYTNGVAFNAIAWATTGVLILLSALLIGGALGIGPATA